MWAMPTDVLASLPALRLPAVVPHLHAEFLSARLLHAQWLRHWGAVQLLLDERLDDDDSLLGPDIWLDWRRQSIGVQLRTTWRDAWEVGLRPLLHDSALYRRRLARTLLPELRRWDPLGVLAIRLQVRLCDETPPRELLDFYLRTRLEGTRWLRRPRVLLLSTLRLWCNPFPRRGAWATVGLRAH